MNLEKFLILLKTNMSNKGFCLMGVSGNDSIWTAYNTTPFYPIITPDGIDSYSLEFAQAYVFDYANSEKLKEPMLITSENLTLDKDSVKKFYVKLTINGENGSIVKASIEEVTSAPSNSPTDVKQLPVKSSIANVSEIIWHIRLADFKGPHLQKIFLRDNLHLNFTKFEQLGYPADNEVVPIISKIDKTKNANEPIKFYSIAKSEKAGNTLEISLNEGRGTIDLYVSGSYY